MPNASRITPGIASGATLPKTQSARIAIGASEPGLVAIDQRHVDAATQQMPGVQTPTMPAPTTTTVSLFALTHAA
jgi:hypothetical protein